MAAVRGFDKVDVRVGVDAGAGFGKDANEGIVLGMEDERGDSDTVEDAGGGGAVVVIGRVEESAIAGDDLVIEFAE